MAPRSAALQPSRHRILSRKDTVHNTVRPVDDMSTANRRRVRHEENLLPPCSAQADVDAQPQTRGYSQRIWPSQRSTKSMLIISSSSQPFGAVARVGVPFILALGLNRWRCMYSEWR